MRLGGWKPELLTQKRCDLFLVCSKLGLCHKVLRTLEPCGEGPWVVCALFKTTPRSCRREGLLSEQIFSYPQGFIWQNQNTDNQVYVQ